MIDFIFTDREFLNFSTSIFQTRLLTENSMWMEETTLRNMHIGHPEVNFIYNALIYYLVCFLSNVIYTTKFSVVI
jgi:hypothetical protein